MITLEQEIQTIVPFFRRRNGYRNFIVWNKHKQAVINLANAWGYELVEDCPSHSNPKTRSIIIFRAKESA